MGGASIKKRKEAMTMEMGLPLGKKEGAVIEKRGVRWTDTGL